MEKIEEGKKEGKILTDDRRTVHSWLSVHLSVKEAEIQSRLFCSEKQAMKISETRLEGEEEGEGDYPCHDQIWTALF